MIKDNKFKVYVAVADNLSRIKAYEYADEFGYDIIGQSGFIDDASTGIVESGATTVICSPKLFDGGVKQLYEKLPPHIKNNCDFYIVSPVKSNVYKLKRPNFVSLRSKDIIEDTLDYFHIPYKAKELYKDALHITLSTPDALSNITRNVYKEVARAHGMTWENVEYKMRIAKSKSYLRCDPEIIYEIFGNLPDGKEPTLSEYLSKLTSYILKNKPYI